MNNQINFNESFSPEVGQIWVDTDNGRWRSGNFLIVLDVSLTGGVKWFSFRSGIKDNDYEDYNDILKDIEEGTLIKVCG